jgi:16S rRNA (cytidine1402-2'-O)-methyltransferase
MNKGVLYLIPVTLGDKLATSDVIPFLNTRIIHTIDEFVVENEKTARKHLKQMGITKPIKDIVLHPLHQLTPIENVKSYLNGPREGRDIGMMSEAGCPAVADPGSELVRLAHLENIKVVPLVGPSAILLALMASGMNGQNFCFNGYLPKEQKDRITKLRELERLTIKYNQTQLFIETPYRNNHVLDDILNHVSPERSFCLACDLTLPDEFIKTQTIQEWKNKKPDINKRQAIFIIGR